MSFPLSDFIPSVPWHARQASSCLGGWALFAFAAARVGASTHASESSTPHRIATRQSLSARLELIRRYLRACGAHEFLLIAVPGPSAPWGFPPVPPADCGRRGNRWSDADEEQAVAHHRRSEFNRRVHRGQLARGA